MFFWVRILVDLPRRRLSKVMLWLRWIAWLHEAGWGVTDAVWINVDETRVGIGCLTSKGHRVGLPRKSPVRWSDNTDALGIRRERKTNGVL